MRQRQRNDDAAEDLRIGRAKRPRNANEDRVDLRDALIHHDDASEERGIEKDNDLGGLADAEIDEHQRNERDRRQGTEEIDQRIDEGAYRRVPPDQEADRNRTGYSKQNSEKNALRRHPDVDYEGLLGQQGPELCQDRMRRWYKCRPHQPGIVDAVPNRDQDQPWER